MFMFSSSCIWSIKNILVFFHYNHCVSIFWQQETGTYSIHFEYQIYCENTLGNKLDYIISPMSRPHWNLGIVAQSDFIRRGGSRVCELEGCLRSSEVLEAESPGYPLSSCSCQSPLRCSAIIGTQLFSFVTYHPSNLTNHLPL